MHVSAQRSQPREPRNDRGRRRTWLAWSRRQFTQFGERSPQSEFSHCGDRSPNWVNCLRVQDQASHVLVDHDWFHDCLGCDFLHGRIHDHLTVRSSPGFERALPCDLRKIDRRLLRIDLGRYAGVRCKHQEPHRALRRRRPALRAQLLRRLQGRRSPGGGCHRRVAPDAGSRTTSSGGRIAAFRGSAVPGGGAGRRRFGRADPDLRARRAQQRSTPAPPAGTATPGRSASAVATAGESRGHSGP